MFRSIDGNTYTYVWTVENQGELPFDVEWEKAGIFGTLNPADTMQNTMDSDRPPAERIDSITIRYFIAADPDEGSEDHFASMTGPAPVLVSVPVEIPATGAWALAVLTLAMIAAGAFILLGRRHLGAKRGGVSGLAAMIAVGAILAFPLDKAFARSICFYVDCPATVVSAGHAFLQLIPMGTLTQDGNLGLVYGFYSTNANIFGGAGQIKNDSSRNWDWRICYDNITRAQYNAAVARIRADLANTPNYNLISFNCANWITSVATAAGVVLPPKINSLDIADPFRLWTSLKKIRDGNMFMGGEADDDNTGLAANGEQISADFPRDYSYVATEHFGHEAPAELAILMLLVSNINDLGTIAVNLEDPLEVQVLNSAPENALISVNWGDESEFDGHRTSFAHFYPGTGNYAASVLVVDQGAVNFYSMDVVVSLVGPTALVTIHVPSTPPATGPNPGFEGPIEPAFEGAPEAVPALSVLGVLVLAASMAAAGIVVHDRGRAA